MARLLVSYDLNQPPDKADYTPLLNRIKEWGGKRVLYSEWLVNTSSTSAAELRDDLARYIDKNDGLLVLVLTGEAAWSGPLMLNNAEVKDMLNAA